MNTYEQLAEKLITAIDLKRHSPPEPVSATIRGEMAVLRLLHSENRGMSAGAIASALHMTTSRVAAVLGSLEKKQYILRRSDPADGRRVLVILTEKGDDCRLARRNEAKVHLTALLCRLGEEDAAAYVRLMERVLSFDDICSKEDIHEE